MINERRRARIRNPHIRTIQVSPWETVKVDARGNVIGIHINGAVKKALKEIGNSCPKRCNGNTCNKNGYRSRGSCGKNRGGCGKNEDR